MKKILLVIFTFLAANSYAQIFSQDFQSSTDKSNYVGTGTGQFGSIYSANSANTTSDIVTEPGNNFLRFNKTGGTTSVITRNTTLNNSASIAVLKYKIRFTGTASTTQSDILAFFLGSETDNEGTPTTYYTNDNISNPPADNLFSLVNLRVIKSNGSQSGTTTGNDYIFISATSTYFLASNWNQITAVTNKTVSSHSYKGPDGGNYSLNTNRQDIWIETTRVAWNQGLSSTNAGLTTFDNFKVRIPSTFPNGNIDLDDISIYNDYSVLPVTLASFSGKKTGSSAQLSWQTVSESNNSHFNILRASENGQFNKIGEVKGNTNSNNSINYSFTDFNPLSATNYYKLQQVDLDGTVNEHNEVVPLTFSKQSSKISANVLSNSSVNIYIDGAKAGNAKLSITDIHGKIISNKLLVLADGNNKINTTTLPAKGVYIATLQNADGKTSIKFVY